MKRFYLVSIILWLLFFVASEIFVAAEIKRKTVDKCETFCNVDSGDIFINAKGQCVCKKR